MFACLILDDASGSPDLSAFAREWSPRVEAVGAGMVVLDATGLTRLFGDAAAWARHLVGAAHARGWLVRLAVAETRVAAVLVAVACPGVTVVAAGQARAALSRLPLAVLATLDTETWPTSGGAPVAQPESRRVSQPARNYRLAPTPEIAGGSAHPLAIRPPPDATGEKTRARRVAAEALLDTFTRWGLHTLGDLAALPAADIAARLGDAGRRWHARARGLDPQPLVDAGSARRFEAHLDLEWPIDGLEPLSFVLARLLEPLCADLQHDERGAVAVHTALDLVSKVTHARHLQLPAPMNDARVLRTLILLDLEAHPPDAAIDRVHVTLEPMPGRRVQFSLFRRALPAPDQIATLNARLSALMGEGRCGSPVLLDTHRPGAFTMMPFAPEDEDAGERRARALRATDAAAGRALRRGKQEMANAEGRVRGAESEAGGTSVPARPAAAIRLKPDSTNHAAGAQSREPDAGLGEPRAVLRRFRRPITVRVTLADAHPVRLNPGLTGLVGGPIIECAGPWRTSGAWWRVGPSPDRGAVAPGRPWDRDEWDAAVRAGPVYRLSRIVNEDRWVVEGIWD